MLNQCILVGRVVQIKEKNETTILTLRIARNYKDPDTGEYEADNLDVQLSDHLSATAKEYLSEESTVGVKARIASEKRIVANEEITLHTIIAEKLTFINTKKSEN
jgi:single-stranded DNA-binding protein